MDKMESKKVKIWDIGAEFSRLLEEETKIRQDIEDNNPIYEEDDGETFGDYLEGCEELEKLRDTIGQIIEKQAEAREAMRSLASELYDLGDLINEDPRDVSYSPIGKHSHNSPEPVGETFGLWVDLEGIYKRLKAAGKIDGRTTWEFSGVCAGSWKYEE